jgi:hypothetical protein
LKEDSVVSYKNIERSACAALHSKGALREESSLRKNAPQDKHVEHAEGWVKCKIHIQGGRCALVFCGSVGGMFLWVLVECVVHCVGVG